MIALAADEPRLIMLKHPTEDRLLDAAISVDADQGQFRAVLHARGSDAKGPRNPEYRQALESLLLRSLASGWVLEEVLLASRKALELPRDYRRVPLTVPYPVQGIDDAAIVARDISTALPSMAREAGTLPRGGNPTKRIELLFSHPRAELQDFFEALIASTAGNLQTETSAVLGAKAPHPGQGRSADSERNRVVEAWAMQAAARHLKSDGWEAEDTSANRPYDFIATKGLRTIRVEVKGTTQALGTVEVTYGEVASAHETETLLFVLHNVVVTRKGSGWDASGGIQHTEFPWRPTTERLVPVRYRYETQRKS